MLRHSRFLGVILIVIAALAVGPPAASAQSQDVTAIWRTARVSGGGGVQFLSSISPIAQSLATGPADSAATFGEMSVRFGRLGFGFEVASLGTRYGDHSYSFASIHSVNKERAWLGIVRMQLVQVRRLTIDIVGGAGVHTTRDTDIAIDPQSPFTTTTDIRRDTSFAIGVGSEATLPVLRHVALVPRFRIYGLRRHAMAFGPDDYIERYYMKKRLSAGVGVQVAW